MLQTQTVRPECLALLRELMSLEELSSFRLAGGTALSLHLGHRISIDLDFFTNQLFDVDELVTFLKTHYQDKAVINGVNKYGVFATVNDIKTDFLYRYEKFLNAELVLDDIRLSSLEDIGAMKIRAAASRASKKDYYDLYELLNVFTFAELIEYHRLMFPNYDIAGVLRSLSDFSEVSLDDEPINLKPVTWDSVQEKLSNEIKNYFHILQQNKLDAENQRQEALNNIINRKKNKN
jgi:hypothetical protein